MEILAYDVVPSIHYPSYVKQASLDDIFEKAEVVSFHVPLHKSTKHLFNLDFLMKMKRPFFLINTSRGGVVEEAALLEGLQQGKVLGAGLDVWVEEPPKFNNPSLMLLQEMPQVILTPHIAGYSKEAKYKMALSLVSKLKALLGAEMSAFGKE